MKWTNKGHEYDEMYRNIKAKKSFYLFGAGDYGTQFINIYKNELTLKGYIDNSPSKHGTVINGLPCYSFDEIKLQNDEAIILTMSQIARVNPIRQLEESGYRNRQDYFIIEEFLSVYEAYEHDKVYFSCISFLPSTACNLNCRYCLNFNPFAKQFYVRNMDDLKEDVDLFFSCVDHIMLFHVCGGEPFVYKHTADLIEYIDTNYGDQIDTLRVITNGTQVPKDDVLEKLSKCKFEIAVDDYRESVHGYDDKFDMLLEKLNEYGIKYYINKAEAWIDLAPEKTDYKNKSEEWLIRHRENCSHSWQELRDGKLFNCNYASYAAVAGMCDEPDAEETYDLKNYNPSKKNELIEFRLGYTKKGYTNFCKRCRGFTPENNVEMIPAKQV